MQNSPILHLTTRITKPHNMASDEHGYNANITEKQAVALQHMDNVKIKPHGDKYTHKEQRTKAKLYYRGGQTFAHYAPIFSSVSRDAPYRRTFLVAVLLHTISDLPGNIMKY